MVVGFWVQGSGFWVLGFGESVNCEQGDSNRES